MTPNEKFQKNLNILIISLQFSVGKYFIYKEKKVLEYACSKEKKKVLRVYILSMFHAT